MMERGNIRHGKHRCWVSNHEYGHRTFSHAVHLYIKAKQHREDWALGIVFGSVPLLVRWLEGLLAELEVHTVAALQQEDFGKVITRFERKWLKLAVGLLDRGFTSECSAVLNRWYITLRTQELNRETRFHKGTTLWNIGRANKVLGVIDSARNFFLLAMFEDIRGNGNTWKDLPARNWLVDQLQLSPAIVDEVGEAVARQTAKHPWNPGEPETLWIHVPDKRKILTRAPLIFVSAIANYFLGQLKRPARTKKEVGDRLELLMSYLFATEPGFEVLGSTFSPDSQNDIVIRNRHSDHSILALGDYILVECKNWKRKVNAAGIRELAGRLQAAGVQTGVLASIDGITGTKLRRTRSGARLAISKEFLRDRTSIIVLNRQILEAICVGDRMLANELLEIHEKVRFDLD
jgi:hypothetical protein